MTHSWKKIPKVTEYVENLSDDEKKSTICAINILLQHYVKRNHKIEWSGEYLILRRLTPEEQEAQKAAGRRPLRRRAHRTQPVNETANNQVDEVYQHEDMSNGTEDTCLDHCVNQSPLSPRRVVQHAMTTRRRAHGQQLVSQSINEEHQPEGVQRVIEDVQVEQSARNLDEECHDPSQYVTCEAPQPNSSRNPHVTEDVHATWPNLSSMDEQVFEQDIETGNEFVETFFGRDVEESFGEDEIVDEEENPRQESIHKGEDMSREDIKRLNVEISQLKKKIYGRILKDSIASIEMLHVLFMELPLQGSPISRDEIMKAFVNRIKSKKYTFKFHESEGLSDIMLGLVKRHWVHNFDIVENGDFLHLQLPRSSVRAFAGDIDKMEALKRNLGIAKTKYYELQRKTHQESLS